MFKMSKTPTNGGECAGIFRDIEPLHDRFKASRVVSLDDKVQSSLLVSDNKRRMRVCGRRTGKMRTN